MAMLCAMSLATVLVMKGNKGQLVGSHGQLHFTSKTVSESAAYTIEHYTVHRVWHLATLSYRLQLIFHLELLLLQ